MKTKKLLTKIATVALLFAVGLTSLIGCGTLAEPPSANNTDTNKPATAGGLTLTTLSADEGIDLGISTFASTQTGYTLEKSVKATITPSGAEGASQGVTWELTWEDGTTTGIENYLKIKSGTGADSLTCYVGCKAAFDKTAILTCTTVVGKSKASCSITYTATARSIFANTSSLGTSTSDSAWGTSYYRLSAGNTYTVPLAYKDVFGNAMDTTMAVYLKEISINGSAIYKEDGAGYTYTPEIKVHKISPLLSVVPTSMTVGSKKLGVDESGNDVYDDLFNCTIDGSSLKIEVTASCESVVPGYRPLMVGLTMVPYSYDFSSYTDSKPVYFTIKVANTSGLETTINVRPFSTVTGVDLDLDNIDFN